MDYAIHGCKIFGNPSCEMADPNLVRSLSQGAQFYMVVYTTQASVTSLPLILALGTIAFVLNMIEIFLDIVFPNREHAQ